MKTITRMKKRKKERLIIGGLEEKPMMEKNVEGNESINQSIELEHPSLDDWGSLCVPIAVERKKQRTTQ